MLVHQVEQLLSFGFLVETEGMCGVVQEDDGSREAPIPQPGVGDSDSIFSVTADFVDARLKIKNYLINYRWLFVYVMFVCAALSCIS